MPEPQAFPIAWNAEAQIRCAFSFRCPQMWDRLEYTADPVVRYCITCDKAVHLALTEEEFDNSRGKGICVAVPIILRPGENQTMTLGSLEDPSFDPDAETSYDSDIEEV